MNNILNPRTIVGNLLLINLIIYLAQYLLPNYETIILNNFALHYWSSPDFRVWQLVTYMFLHADFSHLFFNMFALWMFGKQIEKDLTSKRFATYYFITGVGAALINMFVSYLTISFSSSPEALLGASQSITIGASGAVFGILLAFGMMHPNERIMLLIPPIPIKAKWFVIIYGVLELYSGIRGVGNIAHFAHLGGMIWGIGLLLLWKRQHKIFF